MDRIIHDEIPSTFLKGSLEEGIIAICDLADGMRDAFDYSLQGVLSADDELNRYENAYNWLVAHYQSCAGAFRAIYFMADAISTPFVNETAEIVCVKREA